jgi:hypothetical protein
MLPNRKVLQMVPGTLAAQSASVLQLTVQMLVPPAAP